MTLIRIAEKGPNQRGDLFCQLMDAYFFTLGYTGLQFNVSKAGRELDVQGRHSTENRLLRAECKAEKATIGGSDVNKFAGALEVERTRVDPAPVSGYFVSLSGFKGTAIEQEEDAKGRLVLVTGEQVVSQLIAGKVLVNAATATAAAAKCLKNGGKLRPTGDPEVVATRRGWYWLIYFGDGRIRTHIAIVHGDGEVMPIAFLTEAGIDLVPDLEQLTIISGNDPRVSTENVKARYYEYLAKECGTVSFEGMPTGDGVGARQLKLEDIYVPLRFRRLLPEETPATGRIAGTIHSENDEIVERRPRPLVNLSRLLRGRGRVAILGSPGAGKSTVLKRIAIGFAFPDREQVHDEALPNLNLVPIFLRCRQLNGLAKKPILEVLASISERGTFADFKDEWISFVLQAVRTGTALLLIDGLDEISDEGSRARFGQELQTFLAMYPAVRVVLTSREAGFRIVAPAVAGVCIEYRVAPLELLAVRSLTLAWYLQAMGDSDEVRHNSRVVADEIYATEQVRALATNPLLLTTLLLVRRWVGEVPKKRTVLYNRAIDVLLMTWNVEGHEPLEVEDAVPQLAYVAYQMLAEGLQTISRPRLQQLIVEARKQMPQILGFVDQSPAEFISRVEDRSSLLTLSGHAEDAGQIVSLYEFKHLSFQEYLAALALAAGYVAEGDDAEILTSTVLSHLPRDDWQETISMAVVLSGMKGERIVEAVLDEVPRFIEEPYSSDETSNLERALKILIAALADEALLAPDLTERVSRCIVENYGLEFGGSGFGHRLEGVAASKFSQIFQRAVTDRWRTTRSASDFYIFGEVCSEWESARVSHSVRIGKADNTSAALLDGLDAAEQVERSLAAFGLSSWLYRNWSDPEIEGGLAEVNAVGGKLIAALGSSSPKMEYPVSWALAWALRTWDPELDETEQAMKPLVQGWTQTLKGPLRRFAAWAFLWLPIVDPSRTPISDPDGSLASLLYRMSRKFPSPSAIDGSADVPLASLLAGYYLGQPWAVQELPDRFQQLSHRLRDGHREILAERLGIELEVKQNVVADLEPF
jgi:hypothetical protein